MTKGQIREGALELLNRRGVEAWIQNNIPVKGRKFIGRKGIGDISGFVRANGLRVECEVKSDGDYLRDDQILFLSQVAKSGAWAFVAIQNQMGYVELMTFVP